MAFRFWTSVVVISSLPGPSTAFRGCAPRIGATNGIVENLPCITCDPVYCPVPLARRHLKVQGAARRVQLGLVDDVLFVPIMPSEQPKDRSLCQVLCDFAVAAQKKRQHAEAEDLFRKALAANPEHVPTLVR